LFSGLELYQELFVLSGKSCAKGNVVQAFVFALHIANSTYSCCLHSDSWLLQARVDENIITFGIIVLEHLHMEMYILL
jgi:hypothetical protein